MTTSPPEWLMCNNALLRRLENAGTELFDNLVAPHRIDELLRSIATDCRVLERTTGKSLHIAQLREDLLSLQDYQPKKGGSRTKRLRRALKTLLQFDERLREGQLAPMAS